MRPRIQVKDNKHLAFLLKCHVTFRDLISICDYLHNQNKSYDAIFYSEWQKVKESNGKKKVRVINPSKAILKLLQERINKNVFSQIKYPVYVQGGVKNRSNITNASLHKGNKFKFTTDIKSFFPSVTPTLAYKGLKQLGVSPNVAKTLTELTTFKGKVPQGAPTSTHIANIAFLSIDKVINDYCIANALTYSRFIDDITISSKIDFKSNLPIILNFITENGFRISNKKTHYRHILDITGIETGNNYLKPNKKFYDSISNTSLNEATLKAKKSYENRVKNHSQKSK